MYLGLGMAESQQVASDRSFRRIAFEFSYLFFAFPYVLKGVVGSDERVLYRPHPVPGGKHDD